MRRLAPLDWILSAVKGADYAAILHVSKTPPLEALRAGARSARKRYPVTGARIDGKNWTATPAPFDGVVAAVSGDPMREALAFMDRPLDPHAETPIRQFVAPNSFILTRAHHAAMDGASLAMWLRHQLRVAAGVERPASEVASEVMDDQPALRYSRRLTGARRAGPALWTRSNRASGSKRWLTIELPDGLSGDALAYAALRTIAGWNRAHGAPSTGMSLWMPVNIRERGSAGFGNGTSRVRVDLKDDVPMRQQIHRSLRNGEWAVPASPFLMRLPLAVSAPLLRLYLNRPWADMGSVVFSHIAEWNGRDESVFQNVHKIELIGQLHRRLPLAINAIAHGGKTWVTLTYDPSRLTFEDVSQLATVFEREVEPGTSQFRLTKQIGTLRGIRSFGRSQTAPTADGRGINHQSSINFQFSSSEGDRSVPLVQEFGLAHRGRGKSVLSTGKGTRRSPSEDEN